MNPALAKLCRGAVLMGVLASVVGLIRQPPAQSASSSFPIHPIHPPFKKRWQSPEVEQIGSLAQIGNTLCYGTFSSYGAIDLRTGKGLWHVSLPEKYPSTEVATDGHQLYVEIGSKALLACNADTGKAFWSLPLTGYASPMLAAGKMLFCELPDGVLCALTIPNHRIVWTRNLEPKPLAKNDTRDKGLSATPVLMGRHLFVTAWNGDFLCLNANTGHLVWKMSLGTSEDDAITSLTHDPSHLYTTARGGGVNAWDMQGKRRWHYQASGEIDTEPVLLDGLLCFVSQDGRLSAVDTGAGKLRWSERLSKETEPSFSSLAVAGGSVLVAMGSTVSAWDASGRRLWAWDTERDISNEPLTVLPGGLLIQSDRLYLFAMGEPTGLPATPEARRALAERLTARLDTLDSDEQHALDKLGDAAFEVLLPLVQGRLDAYERAAAQEKTGGKNSFPLYSRFSDAMEHLTATASPKHTPEMLILLGHTRTEDTHSTVLQCLAQKGDPTQSLPVFLQTLRQRPLNWDNSFNSDGVSLTVLSQSHDPQAVQFLIDALADPKADSEIRHAAFVNLARTGGDAGLKAVLAARVTSHTLPPLSKAVGLDALGAQTQPTKDFSTPLLATHADTKNVLWGLIVSGAAGSGSDLWIAHYDGTHWTDPLFTGASLDRSNKYPTDWFERFVGNPALSRDSDGDGWTDLLEARLGTDPQRADTDGDGMIDSQDDNPLTSTSPTGDTAEVLAAAFEARFRFTEDTPPPCLVDYPQGVKPFTLSGWGWVVLPAGAQTQALGATVQHGTAAVSFRMPQFDFTGAAVTRHRGDFGILWNEDHTAAKLQLVTYYGPLSATGYDISLRKFGPAWVVTQADMVWIS